MNGNLHQKTTLSLSRETLLPFILEGLALMGLGMLAITLHARLRLPMNIPGHHGLEFMAILMAGRLLSRIRWAGSIASFGIGLLLLFPLFGFKDPFMGFNYLLPGLVLDLVYNYSGRMKYPHLAVVLGCGLAYALIPLSRVAIQAFTGYPYPTFIKHGYAIPIIFHGLFGLAGGAFSLGIIEFWKRRKIAFDK